MIVFLALMVGAVCGVLLGHACGNWLARYIAKLSHRPEALKRWGHAGEQGASVGAVLLAIQWGVGLGIGFGINVPGAMGRFIGTFVGAASMLFAASVLGATICGAVGLGAEYAKRNKAKS